MLAVAINDSIRCFLSLEAINFNISTSSDIKPMYAQNVSTKICNFLSVCFCFFFHQKCANPGPSLIYVRSFLTNNTFKFYKKCENYPSSIWSWDSNSWHLEYECSPVTTRPGYLSLLPFFFSFLLSLSPSFYATAFFLFHSLPLILCSNVFFHIHSVTFIQWDIITLYLFIFL